MAGRGMRARAPVSYNDKAESMEPAWLKSIKSTKSSTPPKRTKGKDAASKDSAEKENAVTKAPKLTKPAKEQPKAPALDKASPVSEDKKPKEKKASQKGEKSAKPAARGRNAGVTIVPIGALLPLSWAKFLHHPYEISYSLCT